MTSTGRMPRKLNSKNHGHSTTVAHGRAMLNGNPRRPRPRDHRRGEERWVIAR